MADSSRFDFCDKCGALSRDGECQSCGYKDPNYVPPTPVQVNPQSGGQFTQQYGAQYNQQFNGQGYVPYNNPALARPQKNNGGVIAIIVVAIVALSLMLTCGIGFLTVVFTEVITENTIENMNGYWDDSDYNWEYDDYDDSYNYDDSYDYNDDYSYDDTYPSQDVEGLESGKYYMDLYSDFRYDLDYQVEMTNGYYAPEEYENVQVSIEYPQITGSVANLDSLNEMLEYEYQYYLDYFAENYEPQMMPTSYYIIQAACYVTYMDEDVMSVVFHEEMYLDDFTAINFYCLNFDMKNGVLLNNTEILKIDEAFAADFRRRELLENGKESLPDYTDQEIMALLNDEDYLVIFYTPMGMEVGLNLGDSVTFMTYSDYMNFLNSY